MTRFRVLPCVAVFLYLAAGPAAAARRAAEVPIAREPIESLHDTVLAGRTGSAAVTFDGRSTRVPLRRGERLVEIAETGAGWLAAGLRDGRNGAALLVVRDTGAGVERLPSPARGGEVARLAPRLLVDRGELAGVAWLEGPRPDRMAVRAAEWSGGSWIEAEEVAPPAAGSQTGLAQAVLADGSWLLVWSRYDGRSNEIVWSRRAGGGWTPPAPVEGGDRVPDVTPTLIASAGGALLAWSEYDGRDYRLRGARFDAGGWRPLALDAGRGALRPKFRRRPEGTFLVLRSAAPPGWAALEVRGDGTAGRLSRVQTAATERPLLRVDAAGARFEWAGGRAAAAGWERRR